MRPTEMRLEAAGYAIRRYAYRTPIKFGGRVVRDADVVDVAVRVVGASGATAIGWGAMPLGNAWAWPSAILDNTQTLQSMTEFARRVVRFGSTNHLIGDPLRICRDLSTVYGSIARAVEADFELAEPMPRLAQMVAASPLEAAIFDAYGKLHEANAYDLLGPEHIVDDLSCYLDGAFRGEYLDRYTRREPCASMPLYHLVGALDPLTDADLEDRVGDGLPETLGEWIAADGLTHLKIKLAGDQLQWDIDRVLAIDRVASEVQARRGVSKWHYSADFNERCADVQYLLDFLAGVRESSPAAFARLQYLEQPTHRDLAAHPENRMHEAAKIKPVVIDESLLDYESLLLSRELGYTGVALKACKGHHEALLMGAAAQKFGLFLCVQDLTCVGYSFLHSASLAARIPTVAAIEGNGRQYCPAGNRGWDRLYPAMFHVQDGAVGTGSLSGPGLFGCLTRPEDEVAPIERGGDL